MVIIMKEETNLPSCRKRGRRCNVAVLVVVVVAVTSPRGRRSRNRNPATRQKERVTHYIIIVVG